MAFLKKIQRPILRKRYKTIVDVCGGHGLLAMLFLILRKATHAVVLDLNFPESSNSLLNTFTATGLLPCPDAIKFIRGNLVETLPTYLENESCKEETAVFAIHACNFLTDVVIDQCINQGVSFACMPCCHADRNNGQTQQAAKSVGLKVGEAVDIMRMGSIQDRGFSCYFRVLEPGITPENRILIGIPETNGICR